MVDVRIPRVQDVVVPILRGRLPDFVKVGSWVEDIDYRKYPMINVRRVGGYRSLTRPDALDKPVIEMTAYHTDGLVAAEDLYNDALNALYAAKVERDLTEYGYISWVRETMGMTQFSSLFQDTWRIQGMIQLGIRPLRLKGSMYEV